MIIMRESQSRVMARDQERVTPMFYIVQGLIVPLTCFFLKYTKRKLPRDADCKEFEQVQIFWAKMFLLCLVGLKASHALIRILQSTKFSGLYAKMLPPPIFNSYLSYCFHGPQRLLRTLSLFPNIHPCWIVDCSQNTQSMQNSLGHFFFRKWGEIKEITVTLILNRYEVGDASHVRVRWNQDMLSIFFY
jgi:hypothetical protein